MKRIQLFFVLSSLFLLAISLSACAGTAQPAIEPAVVVSPIALATSTPTATPTATAATQRSSSIKLEDCTIGDVSAQCGTYRVYENRSAHSSRQIDLKIAMLPATSDHVEPDPLFYFTGGPGGAATDVAPMLKTELGELNKTRDVVLIDQRGTGGSNLLMCPNPDKPFDVTDAAALSAYAKSCLSGLDADLRWYTTRAYVDDVNEVRQALGYDKINISGGSYGGTVVQVYLLQHPETVRVALINNSTLIDYPSSSTSRTAASARAIWCLSVAPKTRSATRLFLIPKPISLRLSRNWTSNQLRPPSGIQRSANPSALHRPCLR